MTTDEVLIVYFYHVKNGDWDENFKLYQEEKLQSAARRLYADRFSYSQHSLSSYMSISCHLHLSGGGLPLTTFGTDNQLVNRLLCLPYICHSICTGRHACICKYFRVHRLARPAGSDMCTCRRRSAISCQGAVCSRPSCQDTMDCM